ncbi:MAG: hypothetical protein ACYTAN_12380 [Planctomycetota bacterium]
MRPELDGDWWLIAAPPDLTGILPGAERHRAAWQAAGGEQEHNAPVDHHLFRGPDGVWHLWGCVRETAVGRILYRWESLEITQSPWRPTGEIIRCDRSAGESIKDWNGREWIQSPYLVFENGTHYMFYGGHSTDADEAGDPLPEGLPGRERRGLTACQMCLMTSTDGRTWTRHRGEEGFSRVFTGPGEVRDPCLLKIDDLWHCYYAGFGENDQSMPGFFVRTSRNLVDWSDWKIVHQDLNMAAGNWQTECPHVVFRGGRYYLFRTEDYYGAKTHVYVSDDPLDFGVGDASDKYVGAFPAAAVEVYEIDGTEYVTSSHNPALGTQMCRLKWVRD